jgi:hypothetical protein
MTLFSAFAGAEPADLEAECLDSLMVSTLLCEIDFARKFVYPSGASYSLIHTPHEAAASWKA